MNATAENINQLILEIHAAPLAPETWPTVVDRIRQMQGADKALLFSVPEAPGAEFWSLSTGISEQVLREYSTEFAREDVWLHAVQLRGATQAGTICTGEQLIDRKTYHRTRFYNEYLARHDIDCFMNVLLRGPTPPLHSPTAVLSFYRGIGKEAFGELECRSLACLTPHLMLAVATHWKMYGLSLQNAALARTLDAVTVPLFLIARDGRLVFANAAGDAELRRGFCLELVSDCLVVSRRVQDRNAVMSAIRSLRDGRGCSVSLVAGLPARRVVLCTAPLAENAQSVKLWGGAAGLVWLAPAPAQTGAIDRIASLFGLTPAESRLLARLREWETLAEAARALHISVHTTRTQLKSIQAKTGWRTQQELLRMVDHFGMLEPQ
ncbi:MAG: helix-turn-helix transcriptional regulator [Gammaproteobacteria bacterium]|nr:helix-turn-helix transcriptional regulator [Gammaproteobacteria bacterium]